MGNTLSLYEHRLYFVPAPRTVLGTWQICTNISFIQMMGPFEKKIYML